MFCFMCECVPCGAPLLTPLSAALSFCLLPWCSLVHTGQGADMGICVRNASWEVTHLATDSLSIPVPFHSCVDVHISHCSNAFCLSLQTLLARLANGAAHFLIWPFIWGQILIGSRCDGPLCRAKSGCWQTEKFPEKKKNPAQQLCYFPFAPPLAMLRQCIGPHLVLLSIFWDGFLFL